jgi:adenylate cyclase
MVAGTVVLAAMLASGGWWMLRDRTMSPVTAALRPAAYSPQDRRQSVIVLPFENGSDDPAQDGIAAGITRDVTDLIARNTYPLVPAATAAAYRGKTLDLRVIRRDNDVHFALTGNVRRQDGRLIVSATLYETADARLVWAQRFERPDRSDAWNAIVQGIYENFYQATADTEAARAIREHPDSLDKRDLLSASQATPLQQLSKANFLARIALIDRALALDPNCLWALERKARLHAGLVLFGFSSDPDADRAIATKAADQMLLSAPNSVIALRAKAAALRAQGNWDEAAAVLRRVIALQPLESNRHSELGGILMVQGRHKEALDSFMTAKQLAEGSDLVYLIDANIAVALVANDRFPEAIVQARLAIAEFPPDSGRVAEYPWLSLISAESANGQDAEARADLQKFLATTRTWRTIAEIQKFPYFATNSKLLEGLRRAGMPTQ